MHQIIVADLERSRSWDIHDDRTLWILLFRISRQKLARRSGKGLLAHTLWWLPNDFSRFLVSTNVEMVQGDKGHNGRKKTRSHSYKHKSQ